MSRRPRETLECRDYAMPPDFPVVILTGDEWYISDVPSGVMHFHNHLEIGICHSGSAVLAFRDAEIPIHAGDVTMISSGTPHTTWSLPGDISRWSYIFLDVNPLSDPLTTAAEQTPAELCKGYLYDSRKIVHPGQDPLVPLLVEDIVREVTQKPDNYKFYVRNVLNALLCKLARASSESDYRGDGKPFLVAPALRYISDHFMEHFSIDDLARVCQMSSSYFRRVFNETVGTGPLEYLNRTRVMRACSLLQMTDLSVLGVGEAVGFRSLSSFNRHFAEVMGISPTAYRHSINAERPYFLQHKPGWVRAEQHAAVPDAF